MHTWKPIDGYVGIYEVSDSGEVRRHEAGSIPKLLRQERLKRNYRRVGLSKNGVTTRYSIHRLVALAFIGPSNGLTVNHKDGNPANNHVSNLEYMTFAENIQHAYDVLGKVSQKGTSHGRHKLTDVEVLEIFKRRASGEPIQAVADAFGCCIGTVSMIANRVRWTHLTQGHQS